MTPFLIFRVQAFHFAVETNSVVEVIPLPEIFPLEETPSYVAGVINLRGRILPVIDLNLRFGHPSRPYRLSDCIVVLENAGVKIGVLADEVQTVRSLAAEEISSSPLFDSVESEEIILPHSRFVRGVASLEDRWVMLLNLDPVFCLAQTLPDRQGLEEISPSPTTMIFSRATPEEQAVFSERSRRLAQPVQSEASDAPLAVAVVSLGKEIFGIDLQAVREFAQLGSVTPVPCCPPHIVGQMNLRGEILTIVNVSTMLGLPPLVDRERSKVVVMTSAHDETGILVDELLEVVYLQAQAIVPSLHPPRESSENYFRGTTPYGSQTLSLVDWPALLAHSSLAVSETP